MIEEQHLLPAMVTDIEEDTGNISVLGATPNPIKPEVAAVKAQRYHFALDSKSPGETDIYNTLLNGMDKEFTERMMNLDALEESSKRQARLLEFVNTGRERDAPLTEAEYNDIVSRPAAEMDNILSNPDTYFSKKQAKAAIDKVWDSVSRPEVDAQVDTDLMKRYVAKQYALQELLRETQERLDNESTLTKAVNIGELFIPVKSWWNTADALTNAPTSSWLQGTNLREQSDYVWANPDVDATVAEVRNALDEIYASNPYDALSFIQAINSMGEDEEGFQNAMQAAAIATGVGAQGVVSGAMAAAGKFAVRAGARGTTVPGMLDHAGQAADAAFRNTITELRLAAQFDAGAAQRSFDDLAKEIPPIMNPDSVINQGNQLFSSGFMSKFTDMLKNQAEALVRTGLNVVNISRLEPGTAAYDTALRETQRLFSEQFPSTNGAILSIRPITSQNNVLTNTDHIAVALGRTDGSLFQTVGEAQANASLYELDPKSYFIAQRGKEYYIEITKAVDETLPSVRDALTIDTMAAATPENMANRLLGYFRTKDELLPADINRELKIAEGGAQQFSSILANIVSNKLNPLRKDSKQRLLDFLDYQADVMNPRTQKPGVFSSDLDEFARDWQTRYGRPPREDETEAYFTYVQVNDAEWMFNNLNIYKGKTRLGFENFHFEKVGVQTKVGPTIEGRLRDLDQLYRYDDDANILIWDNSRTGQPALVRKNQLTQEARDDIARLVNEDGYRLIQLSPYGDETLRQYPTVNIPNAPINYVLVQNFSSSPLKLQQIPYRGGPHQIYAAREYISQPNIATYVTKGAEVNYYRGDRNLFAFETRQQANRYLDALEEARNLYRTALDTGDETAIRQFLTGNTRLPFTFDDFTRMFSVNGGDFDVNIPFYARARGQNIHTEHKLDRTLPNFIDSINTPHNPLNDDVNLRYATERDRPINTIINRGSPQAPYHTLRRARRVDPYHAMARAIRNVTQARYLDDLKIKAAERYVREFGDILTGSSEEIQRYPMRALQEDRINKAHPNKERVAAARNYRRAMMEFLNTKSEDQYFVDSIVTRVADTMIRAFGDEQGLRRFEWVEPHLISTIKDPTKFLRSVAFYPTMGFWNPKQFFMQAQGTLMTAALEGLPRATKAGSVSPLMRPLHMRADDAALDRAADIATNFGWKADHFKEAYLALQRTGFQNVGGEFGTLDDFLNPNVITSRTSKVLENGLMFFRGGEKVNRITAWNAAYLRWRDANPLGKLDDNSIKTILERASLLTNNMTRSSNAGWNQGWASIPTQFFSYHARMMDLMLGSRLDLEARARLIATYSAMYGVPSATLGLGLGVVWPWHEESRKMLIENGIDVNDKVWDAFTNGLPQMLINMATGGEVNPAVSATFGPSGLSFFRDIINREKSAVEIATGPAGRTAMNLWDGFSNLARAGYGEMEPLMMAIWGTTIEDNAALPLTAKDFEPLLQNFSTANNAMKAYYAYTTGQYFTKNGIDVIGDGYDNPWNAFFTGVLGTNPQSVNDFYSKIKVKKEIEQAQNEMRKEAMKYYKMALQPNIADKERMQFLARAKAAMEAGKLTSEQRRSVFNQTVRGMSQTALEEIDDELRNADKDRQTKWYNMLRGTE